MLGSQIFSLIIESLSSGPEEWKVFRNWLGHQHVTHDAPSRHAHDPHVHQLLAHVAQLLWDRYTHLTDLDELVDFYRSSLALRPNGHPKRSGLLTNLANTLVARFDHGGTAENLQESIALHRAALDLRSEYHQGRFAALGNLANSLTTRFQYLGNVADLDESTVMH
ncbi:TTC13_2 [Sanghuangporus sanghuang]